MKTFLILFVSALPFLGLQAQCNKAGISACMLEAKAEPGSLVLPAEQWIRLWMDEIVARDLYTELEGMTQRPIFKNIGKAEVHHRKMIEGLLTSAGVEVPEAPKAGNYPDKELQEFYNEKLKSGKTSELAAFKSGEAFEIQDIAELEAALKTEGLSEAEKSLLTALVAASNRHLKAFQHQLGKYVLSRPLFWSFFGFLIIAILFICLGRSIWNPWLLRIHGGKTVEDVVRKLEAGGLSAQSLEKYTGLQLIGLKAERMLEVYGINATGSHHLIQTFPFTGFSGKTGPKLREGDLQIPEGIYEIEYLNPNSSYHLSLKLNYPNAFDRKMGERDGRDNLGFDIFIHGKSGTVGCIPIGDAAIEELFFMVAKIGSQNVRVILAPHDFRQGLPDPEIDGIEWEPELYTRIRSALSGFEPTN